MSGTRVLLATVAVCALAAAPTATAETFKWADPLSSGSWSQTANWQVSSGGGWVAATRYPNSADDVAIFERNSVGDFATRTVTLSEDIELGRMEVKGTYDKAEWKWTSDTGNDWTLTVNEEIDYTAVGGHGASDWHHGIFDVVLAGDMDLTLTDLVGGTTGHNQVVYLKKSNTYTGETDLIGDPTRPRWRCAQLSIDDPVQSSTAVHSRDGGYIYLTVNNINVPIKLYPGGDLGVGSDRTFDGPIEVMGDGAMLYTTTGIGVDFRLNGPISGDYRLTLANKGTTHLQNQAIDVAEIEVWPYSTSGNVYSRVVLDVDADWDMDNDWSGRGVVKVGPTANRTLTARGAVLKALDTHNSRQKPYLRFDGDVALARDGGEKCTVYATVYGGGLTPTAAPVAGTDFEQLQVTGALTGLGNADLHVHLDAAITSLTVLQGKTFPVLTTGTDISGSRFDAVTFDPHLGFDLGGPVGYTFDGAAGSVTVEVTIRADANMDLEVDVLDLAVLANNFGATGAGWRQADFNYDGDVDVLDLAAIANNFGKNANPGGGGGPGSVPGPSSLAALALGAGALLRRRRASQGGFPGRASRRPSSRTTRRGSRACGAGECAGDVPGAAGRAHRQAVKSVGGHSPVRRSRRGRRGRGRAHLR